jgi:tetratricopeptide (TPR) repeat protein
MGRELGDERDVATQTAWRQAQALMCAHRGQHEQADRLVREALAITTQTDSLNTQGDVLCDLAEVLERADRQQEARTVLEEALERYKQKQNLAMVAQVHRRIGVQEDAIRLT